MLPVHLDILHRCNLRTGLGYSSGTLLLFACSHAPSHKSPAPLLPPSPLFTLLAVLYKTSRDRTYPAQTIHSTRRVREKYKTQL
ncbi:hypothetical protein VTO73DRAFT_13708 [Trametes versicolor]